MRLFSTFVLSLVCLSAATVTAQEAPGSPGLWPVPDAFNTVVDWNRTRTPTEPQQIHLSLASDAEYARVQFATLQDVNSSILKYWPKKQADKVVTIQGQVCKRTDLAVRKNGPQLTCNSYISSGLGLCRRWRRTSFAVSPSHYYQKLKTRHCLLLPSRCCKPRKYNLVYCVRVPHCISSQGV